MADKKRMEGVDMTKEFEKLNDTDKYFIKKLEKMNKERAQALMYTRKRNRFTAAFFGLSIMSIYFFSMYGVKQEKFLDFETMPEDKKNAS